jgi:antitoxin FitA
MPINLSIKNAPDEMVHRLRQRAERHHRSLQGELLAEVRRLGLRTPSDSAAIIRADRDRR